MYHLSTSPCTPAFAGPSTAASFSHCRWGDVPCLLTALGYSVLVWLQFLRESHTDLTFKSSLWDLVLKGPSDFGVGIVILLRWVSVSKRCKFSFQEQKWKLGEKSVDC